MTSITDLLKQKLAEQAKSVEEIIEKRKIQEDVNIEQPTVENSDVEKNETSSKNTINEPDGNELSTNEEKIVEEIKPVRQRKSRTKKVNAEKVATEPEVIVRNDMRECSETLNSSEEKQSELCADVEMAAIIEPTDSISRKLSKNEMFDYNDMHWTPHKYKIGDTVYVPIDEQVTNTSMYDPIKLKLVKVAKKLTVATVSITNKVSYTFKETSKIIANERYVFSDKAECEKMCEEFNQ